MITLEDINKACLEALPARWKQYLGGKADTLEKAKAAIAKAEGKHG